MLGKKGDALSLNIVVIAIIAVIILVVLAIIFTGGVGNAYRRMSEFFGIGTTGRTLESIRETCNLACTTAQASSSYSGTSYCTSEFRTRDSSGNDVYYVCDNTNYNIVEATRGDYRSAGVSCSGVIC